MISPPRWEPAQLEAEIRKAEAHFRSARLVEPLEEYLEGFDRVRGVVEDLLEQTVDLSRLRDQAVEILTHPAKQEAFRYLAGPPISKDDLTVLAEASLSAERLRADPIARERVVETVLTGLDRRRFPWLAEEREPTETERNAAIIASAALVATRKLETNRRNAAKQLEEQIDSSLVEAGLARVDKRPVEVLNQAPGSGEFCRESKLGSRKADLIIGLWDGRIMPIEAKVSNSATNSVKRVQNDAAAKAETWRRDFGTSQIVPAAVLAGVFKLHNLLDAQGRGLTLFWAHDLQALANWIESTRPK